MRICNFLPGGLICLAALAAPLCHAAQFVIGQVAPLSGLDAGQARAYSTGLQMYLNQVNKTGGINGNTFVLARKDDSGRSEDTVSATRELLAESRPLVLSGYFGNRNMAALLASGLLEKEKVPLVGYRSSEVGPATPLVYSVRAGLQDEINKIVDHLAIVGIKRIGLFYEEGPGSALLLSSIDHAMKRTGTTLNAKASYPAGTAKVTAAVNTLAAAEPQAIILVAGGSSTAGFVDQYRSAGGSAQLFSHSGADIEQIAKRLSEEQMQGLAIAQVTPNPYKISIRLTKEFNDTLAKGPVPDVPVSYAMMEGYIAAKVIVEAVRRVGSKVTREALASALDSMDRYDLGGYQVAFQPGMRSGSRFVELSIVSSSGRIRQ